MSSRVITFGKEKRGTLHLINTLPNINYSIEANNGKRDSPDPGAYEVI